MNIKINRALRIIIVLIAQGVLILGNFTGYSLHIILAFAGLLIGFLLLSHQASKTVKLQKLANAKLKLEERNNARKNGDWVKFEDDGAEYFDVHHPYSRDLGLFGKNSLFQYLNETKTQYGKNLLKLLFITEKRDKGIVLRRQAAVKEIAENKSFCDDFRIKGILSKNISHDPQKIVDFFENKSTLFEKPSALFMARVLPVITFVLLGINFIVGMNVAMQIILGISVLSQVMIFLSLSTKTEAVLKELSKFKNSLDDFGDMAELIRNVEFLAELNQSWQAKLPQVWHLKKISWAIKVRNFAILDLLLNVFFLWDVHCISGLEKARAKGASEIRAWLEAIGYFEAMTSVAILPQIHLDWTYPEFSEKLVIKAKNMGHPLIDEEIRIVNDFTLDGIAIISGSNMSGKTTFLRTIGINLVLANMGAPVCASRFFAPNVDIWTCMKPPDNLKRSISTFYAELLRIKHIIANEKPMLFLIDEIFAGTNSEDRVEGAIQVLNNLYKRHNLGLITTHDLEVCRATDFANYHFNEHYIDNELRFDFKIKQGISTTRNAKFLMQMIGIEMN